MFPRSYETTAPHTVQYKYKLCDTLSLHTYVKPCVLIRYANAFSSSTMNPIAIDPSILEPPGADYAVESVDALIREVSDHIGRDWMVLARSLGFTETDIQSIEYADERDLKEQIHQFFYEWKRRDGQDATQDKLITVLYESGLNEVLKKTKAQKSRQHILCSYLFRKFHS